MRKRLFFATFFMLCTSCGPDETISAYANPLSIYVLQSLNGEPIAARADISFPEKGTVSGNGPCNVFQATQSAPYPWLALGPIAATRRACPDLALESAYFQALEAVTLVEVSGPFLLLTNTDGLELVFQSE